MVRQRIVCVAVLAFVTACGVEPHSGEPCSGLDPVLAESSFVLLLHPQEGARVSSPFGIRGCSRTFESNVVWELRGRDGRVLASGNTTGGGVDGPAQFEASAQFTISQPEVGHLLVFEEDVSGGEGFPPSRTVMPVVLGPEAR
jgi:hypothetical protein